MNKISKLTHILRNKWDLTSFHNTLCCQVASTYFTHNCITWDDQVDGNM